MTFGIPLLALRLRRARLPVCLLALVLLAIAALFATRSRRQPIAVPELALETVGGGTWDLTRQRPEHFTLLVFYRGHH